MTSHKPTTDAQAKKMFAIARKREYDGKVTKHMSLEACAGTVLRLLADRTVAMEIIGGLIKACSNCGGVGKIPCIDGSIERGEPCYVCGYARALIAAVKGGEG